MTQPEPLVPGVYVQMTHPLLRGSGGGGGGSADLSTTGDSREQPSLGHLLYIDSSGDLQLADASSIATANVVGWQWLMPP